MNRYAALGLFGLGLMVSPLLSSPAGSAVPASPKIGMIDIEDTLSNTPAGKRANDAFEKGRKAKQTELDKKQEELKKADGELVKAAADLDKQKALLKPEAYKAKAEELLKKKSELEKRFVDLQTVYVKLEKELTTDRQKLIQGLLKQAEPLVAKIAKAEGVHLIVDQSATVWADPALDLTAKLKAEMK